ncbi:MAG: hypothetical protein ACREV9_14295 [Burkholderiales bacterium]
MRSFLAALSLVAVAWMPASFADQSAVKKMFGAAVSARDLDQNRGKQLQVIQVNENELDAALHDNAAVDNVTGSNFITTGAFGNTTGFPLVVQNTGNNVVIQNSTILHLNLQ